MKYVLLGLMLSFNVAANTDCFTDWKGDLKCEGDSGRVTCHKDWKGHLICN